LKLRASLFERALIGLQIALVGLEVTDAHLDESRPLRRGYVSGLLGLLSISGQRSLLTGDLALDLLELKTDSIQKIRRRTSASHDRRMAGLSGGLPALQALYSQLQLSNISGDHLILLARVLCELLGSLCGPTQDLLALSILFLRLRNMVTDAISDTRTHRATNGGTFHIMCDSNTNQCAEDGSSTGTLPFGFLFIGGASAEKGTRDGDIQNGTQTFSLDPVGSHYSVTPCDGTH
jgi:hypothetical protein